MDQQVFNICRDSEWHFATAIFNLREARPSLSYREAEKLVSEAFR